MSKLGRLHVVTDTRPGRDALAVVAGVLAAGVDTIQVRVADAMSDRAAYELAGRILGLCRAHRATCLVNDRLHVALAVGATARTSVPTTRRSPRRILGPGAVLGATARDRRGHRGSGTGAAGGGTCGRYAGWSTTTSGPASRSSR
jgi:thiamine-phosphate pyrophosphorylase